MVWTNVSSHGIHGSPERTCLGVVDCNLQDSLQILDNSIDIRLGWIDIKLNQIHISP